tara:strand:+ start:690 stop:1811 length:1122 start_codon:yes stop_codon:yes gene_type:complete
MKKLIYITPRKTNILSNFANSKQIYNTCNEIGRLHDNFEVFFNRYNIISKEDFHSKIKEKYNEINFQVSSTYNYKFFWNDFSYAIYVSFRYLFKNDIFFTRQDWIGLFLTLLGKKVYFEAHDFDSKRLCLRIMKKLITKKTNLNIIVISKALKDEFRKHNFKNSINVIHDGVDLKKFVIKSKNEARIKLGIDLKDKVILYSGALRSGRGVMRLIEIARITKDKKFYILGGRNKERLQYLKEKSKDLDNIFFKGYVSEFKLIDFMNAADIFLMPHQKHCDIIKYTSPLKMFEYLAMGKPIVASDFPVFKEVLKDKNNSLLAKYDSAKDFSNKIHSLFQKNELYDYISNNAIDSVIKYTWEARAKNILEIIYEKN